MPNKIVGSVVSLSDSGGLVTDITAEQLTDAPRDDNVSVSVGGHQTVGIYPADHGQPDSTFVALLPENETLRIELIGIPLSEMLGIQVGESVSVEW
ncbi:MAG: adenosylmethionine-8-amino-7-oxononanoate aminotransferase [Planctomycetota bacterium]|nr:adenosylmethionine-8-amino-7-oxononanoate aminotransferase [Planctomycetota bacterium]